MFAPPPKLTVTEWADKYRQLSPEYCATPGQWRTENMPHLRGIMDAVTEPNVRRITVKKSSQVGWSDVLMNIIGYYIHQDPSPMLLINPTLSMSEGYSKERITPTIRDTPVLLERVGDAKSRSSGNTLLQKTFPGGVLTLVGANSPNSLASRPIRIIMGDETSRYPQSASKEGNPIEIVAKRKESFWNYLILLGSTPTIQGICFISQEFEKSDKRYYYVPCPHCGEFQTLEWENVHWDKSPTGVDLPETAFLGCKHCAGVIRDHHKMQMVRKGEWRATKPFNEETGHAGFFINALYSPLPGATFSAVVRAYLDAVAEGKNSMTVFVNTYLGEAFDDQLGEGLGELDFQQITYKAEVPEAVLILTAGVDVQLDRFEIAVIGWADSHETSYAIDQTVIYGDTTLPQTWENLDEFLLKKTYKSELGTDMRIVSTCVDSGFNTQLVYKYCKARVFKRIYAVKGVPGTGIPVIRQSKTRSHLVLCGVDEAKSLIYSRLKLDKGQPSSIYFPKNESNESFEADYFAQLTCEKVVVSSRGGLPIRKFVKPKGGRNEALDTMVYAYAAMLLIAPKWAEIAKRRARSKPVVQAAAVEEVKKEVIPDAKKPAPTKIKRPRRGGFVKRY